LFNERKVILHITGLGIAFSNSSLSYLFLRFVSQIIFLFKLFRANNVIVQNHEDAKDIWGRAVWKRKVKVIKGSGVDISYFNPSLFHKIDLRQKMNISDNEIIFICVTRLIWEKGIKEMVDAFQELNKELVVNPKLLIVGWSDKHNPRHVEASYINEFINDKNIKFLGRCDNVRELLALSDVFIYPSYYREGIPRGILEALSIGLPVITTNMPGCNLTVIQNQNGFIISPKSSEQVKEAVKKMIYKNNLSEMGIKSRFLVEKFFTEDIIFFQIENIYKQ
uniref:glycosyltransferase n=1 Tax=Algoriphagus sp. TaxID=1872435 RepID=UPI0040483C63